jgi:ribosomal protein S1
MMIGDIVGFTGKRGNQVSGKVTKIAKKYVTVDCGVDGNWRVPGNHLTKLGIGA